MGTAAQSAGPEELLARVQELQTRLGEAGDGATFELAEELVGAVVQMYGEGLTRIVRALLAAGAEGERLARALAEDPHVATLLLVHDLHPVPLQERVRGALEQVRPYMESHGGDVELLSLSEGVARIRLRGSCSDCAASAVTLELAIKQALDDAAPDLDGLEVEGVASEPAGPSLPLAPAPGAGPFELPVIAPAPAWFELENLEMLPPGRLLATEVAGAQLVVANVDGALLAYRDSCPGCGASLRGGELSAGALACPQCARTYFLPRAGRSLDAEAMQLEPVPLLREQGRVKVALPS